MLRLKAETFIVTRRQSEGKGVGWGQVTQNRTNLQQFLLPHGVPVPCTAFEEPSRDVSATCNHIDKNDNSAARENTMLTCAITVILYANSCICLQIG